MLSNYSEETITPETIGVKACGDSYESCTFDGNFIKVNFSCALFLSCDFSSATFDSCNFSSAEFDAASEGLPGADVSKCNMGVCPMTRDEYLIDNGITP